MTAHRKTTKPRKAKQYSADAMALRLIGGLLLVAAGVLMFLSVFVSLSGSAFSLLRGLTFGLGGSLAFLVPVIPVWGGVLLILSARTRQPVRTWGFAALILLLLLTAVTLLSRTVSGGRVVSLLDSWVLEGQTAAGYGSASDAYEVFLGKAYALGSRSHLGGGLIGMLLAWPFWKTIGSVLGSILSIVLMIAFVFFILHLSPKALIEKIQGKEAAIRQRSEQRQKEIEMRDLQMRQQEASLQGWPAGGQQEDPQQSWQQLPEYQQRGGFQPTADEKYVQARTDQLYTEDLNAEEASGSWVSQIFGKKKQKAAQSEPEQQAAFVRVSHGRSTAGGERAHTRRAAADEPPVMDAEMPQMEQAQAERDISMFKRPEGQRQISPQTATKEGTGSTAAVTEPEIQTQPQGKTQWQLQLEEKMHQQTPQPVSGTADAESGKQSGRGRRRSLQQPKESWKEDDTPPWEEKTVHETVVPVVPNPISNVGLIRDEHMKPLEEAPMEKPLRPYTFPSVSLLQMPEPPKTNMAAEDAVRARQLEDTLESFHIPSKVKAITHGPAVSRFELEIAGGIRVNRVSELDRNIAMDMAVPSVRIEAPIPGKSLVGVEVPNRAVTPVSFREVLETDAMRQNNSPLTVALGKDIAGTPVICNLEKMPHLLIAGATGSGKSVCINSIIVSLLYRTTPEEVRLILIDPKKVELQCYNGVPHLLIPVVSDPHKAAGALQWAVNEMDERYQKLTARGVRSIQGYNAKLEEGEAPMSRIVIVIDELADLMLVCKKDVESHIQRLAQLARAAGIHIIVATQRPSVNVITGVIKANIPSRISFKVTSNVDSRTILDHPGAEMLLGYGDMLYLPTGTFSPTRVQGCFLKDDEVNAITDYIRQNNDTNYDESIQEIMDNPAPSPDTAQGSGDAAESGDSDLLMQAIEITVQAGQVSTSMLQRKLSLGYARAARLVDRMEELGIVSQKDGAKPRLCLITREQLEEMKRNGLLEA